MDEKITSRQAILLITISRIVTVLTIMPIIYIEPANQDIWIVIIVSFFYTILTSIPLLFLACKFRGLNLIGYIEKIFGKIIGKGFGIIYILFYIRMAILFIYISIQMVRSSFLPNTNPILTIVSLIIVCVYIASKGSVTISRYAELLVPIILGLIGIFIILGFSNVDLSIFLPIYKDSNFWEINYGAIKLTYLFFDLNILLMIAPRLETREEKKIIFVKSVIYSLLFILVTVVVTQGTLGIEQSKHSNFPLLIYIRLIDSYSTFERLESIYILLWIFGVIIKITSYIHIADEGMKEILKNRSQNFYLYTIGVISILITFYLAEINPKSTQIVSIDNWEYLYLFIHKTVIPLLAIIVYFFRRKTFERQERLSD